MHIILALLTVAAVAVGVFLFTKNNKQKVAVIDSTVKSELNKVEAKVQSIVEKEVKKL